MRIFVYKPFEKGYLGLSWFAGIEGRHSVLRPWGSSANSNGRNKPLYALLLVYNSFLCTSTPCHSYLCFFVVSTIFWDIASLNSFCFLSRLCYRMFLTIYTTRTIKLGRIRPATPDVIVLLKLFPFTFGSKFLSFSHKNIPLCFNVRIILYYFGDWQTSVFYVIFRQFLYQIR